jgi:Copper type II ascorbate-dependent monooxygenase, C-terminal domain/EF hand
MLRMKGMLATLLAGASAFGLAACSSEPAATLVGKKVDDYMLVDQTGMGHILRYDTLTPAVVLVSYVNGDEGSQAAAKAMEAAAAKHPGVVVHLINSAEADNRLSIAAEAKAQNISLPILDDEFQLIGNSLGFTYAGEAVIVNPKTWDIVFHGPADKVEGALGEFIAGGKVAAPEFTEVKGTKLTFADRGKDFSNISYTNDVVPILMAKCVDCHQPNGIAPWHMSNYTQVKTFAPMIREAIRRDRMPPFDADDHYRAFEKNENLTAEETKTLIHWIEAGAPSDIAEGAEDPLVKGVAGRPDWPLGEPDLVVSIPAYDVPAAGVVDYQIPAVKSPLTEGKWLKATTFKPGNRQGVHHILAGWLPKMPANGRGFDWEISMGGYAVGNESNVAPDNWATWVPAGGAISFQMHYTPIGKAFTDDSKIAFYFQDEAPDMLKRQVVIADPSIEIAANTARHHETAYVLFPADAQIYAAQVHAHYRGYASKLTAIYPDGKEEILLNMPHYDFNWQRDYIFKDLIEIPAGTKVVADYWYDNSANNKALFGANTTPHTSPAKKIFWGDQSFQEMLFTAIQFRWKDETAENPRDDLQAALRQTQLLTMADDNRDGKLQEAELRIDMEEGVENVTSDSLAPMHQQFKANFAAIDADKDGGLSMQELGAALEQMQQQGGRGR